MVKQVALSTNSISKAPQNIEQLIALSEDELSHLIDQYPYVSIYKVVLARKYKDSGHSSFRDILRSAALQAPDRVSLYNFLHLTEELASEQAENEDVITQEDVVSPVEDIETTTVNADAESKVDEPLDDQVIEDHPTAHQMEEQPEIDAGAGQEKLDEGLEAHGVDDIVVQQVYPEEDVAEEAIPDGMITDAEETASRIQPIARDKMEVLRELAADKVGKDPEADKKETDEVDQPTLNEQLFQTAAKKNVSLDEKHTFLEWLDILEGEPGSMDGQSTPDPVEDEVSVLESQIDVLETQIDEHSAASGYQADIQREVADMEENEEGIQLDVTESKVVKELADKSIELNSGIVTETLAKLMLMQGKKTESIALYEQLRLKYPEKSDYFAAQIDAIKAN